MRDFHDATARWDAFLDEIDAIIDDKIGPSDVAPTSELSFIPPQWKYVISTMKSLIHLFSVHRGCV